MLLVAATRTVAPSEHIEATIKQSNFDKVAGFLFLKRMRALGSSGREKSGPAVLQIYRSEGQGESQKLFISSPTALENQHQILEKLLIPSF